MPASKIAVRVRLRYDKATELANKAGWTSEPQKAAFFGVTQSNWSRVTNPSGKKVTDPGALFIAAVLASPAAEQFPDDVTFDNLFEVVPA